MLHCFGLAASTSTQSMNQQLLRIALEQMEALGHEVTEGDYYAYDCPAYQYEAFEADGLPEGAAALERDIALHDALIFAVPEYNWSFPGHLKNLIDWLSSNRPICLNQKPILLIAASPSLHGGSKGLQQLRAPLESLGAFVYPGSFCLSQADQLLAQIDSDASRMILADLDRLLHAFADFAQKLNPSDEATS